MSEKTDIAISGKKLRIEIEGGDELEISQKLIACLSSCGASSTEMAFRYVRLQYLSGLEKLLDEEPFLIEAQRPHSNTTLLDYAVEYSSPKVVAFLLDRIPILQEYPEHERLLISSMLNHDEHDYCAEIVKLLIQHGASIQSCGDNISGWTPLCYAVCHNRLEAARFLISCGAKVDIDLPDDESLLNLAAERGIADVIPLLIEHGLRVNSKKYKSSPLHAAAHAHPGTAQMLILLGADINAVDQQGRTALHCASYGEQPELVRILLEKGSAVNACDDVGSTPLHYAMLRCTENLDVARLLIENGADVNAKNECEETPTLYATSQGSKRLIRLFAEHDADFEIDKD